MAKDKEIEKVLNLFAPTSAKAVERMLRRAAEKEMKAIRKGGRRPRDKLPEMTRATKALAGALGRSLGKAMGHRGAPKRQAPSIRQRAPVAADGSGGGRPFHFKHSVVTKGAAPGGGGTGKTLEGGQGPGSSKRNAKKAGTAASHHRYIERETAVEREPGEIGRDLEREGRDPDDVGFGQDVGRGKSGDAPEMASGPAGQRYIENPVKLANGENVVFSFGTIGETFEERVSFWDELEANERAPDARVQNRLIVELPHEASPQARFEMVKDFCDVTFERMGLPYWAALHAPGRSNDARNYHAHIVFSERPAKRMVDHVDGREKWDFAIRKEYRSSSRNLKVSHPFRQPRHPEMRKATAIKSMRRDFCKVVNAVLEREKVAGEDGRPVRYDARSYAEMGLDVVPARSIDRIVADKMKDGPLLVRDADWTRKMVRQELKLALAQRDAGTMEVIRLDDVFREAAAKPLQAQRLNARLPREMRIPAGAMPTREALKAAGDGIVAAKRQSLRVDLVERSTRTALDLVVAATDPEALSATRRRVKDPGRLAELPDTAHAALLREAALDELRLLDRDTAAGRTSARLRFIHAVADWKAAIVPPTSVTSPEMMRIIGEVREPNAAFGRRTAPTGVGIQADAPTVGRPPASAELPPKPPRRGPPDVKASIAHLLPKLPSAAIPTVAELVGVPLRASGIMRFLWSLPTPAERVAMLDAILDAAAEAARIRDPDFKAPPKVEPRGRPAKVAWTTGEPVAVEQATKAKDATKAPIAATFGFPSRDEAVPVGPRTAPAAAAPMPMPSEADMKAGEAKDAAQIERLRKRRAREEEARLRRKAILAKGRGR